MTERAGAALSHVLIRVSRTIFFRSSGAANFPTPAGAARHFAENASGNLFHRRAHGCVDRRAGNADFAGSFNRPHYLADFSSSQANDFVRQYFRVIMRKLSINS
jgi:hypothetical protein